MIHRCADVGQHGNTVSSRREPSGGSREAGLVNSPARLQRILGNRIIQRAADHGNAPRQIAPDIERDINAGRGGGIALPATTRQTMEEAFGADFSSVRIHSGASAHHLNRSLSARAFTSGSDIFFSRGAYNPDSRAGQRLIAHELTHVLQQTGGAPTASVQGKLTLGPADDAFEREADRAADAALRCGEAGSVNPAGSASCVQREGDSDSDDEMVEDVDKKEPPAIDPGFASLVTKLQPVIDRIAELKASGDIAAQQRFTNQMSRNIPSVNADFQSLREETRLGTKGYDIKNNKGFGDILYSKPVIQGGKTETVTVTAQMKKTQKKLPEMDAVFHADLQLAGLYNETPIGKTRAINISTMEPAADRTAQNVLDDILKTFDKKPQRAPKALPKGDALPRKFEPNLTKNFKGMTLSADNYVFKGGALRGAVVKLYRMEDGKLLAYLKNENEHSVKKGSGITTSHELSDVKPKIKGGAAAGTKLASPRERYFVKLPEEAEKMQEDDKVYYELGPDDAKRRFHVIPQSTTFEPHQVQPPEGRAPGKEKKSRPHDDIDGSKEDEDERILKRSKKDSDTKSEGKDTETEKKEDND